MKKMMHNFSPNLKRMTWNKKEKSSTRRPTSNVAVKVNKLQNTLEAKNLRARLWYRMLLEREVNGDNS